MATVKVAGTATTVYVYSGTKPIAEYVGGGLSKEYIYAGGGPMLATVAAGGAVTYEHPDHLSIRAESDSNGNLIRSTGLFPFGEAWYDSSPGSKWQFTTYERDSESQLDYAEHRFYSSRVSRFLSPDPLAGSARIPQSMNRYAYAFDDPVNAEDPSGLITCKFKVQIKNDTNLSAEQVEAIEARINFILGATTGLNGESVGATFTAGPGADFDLLLTNASWLTNAVNGMPFGAQSTLAFKSPTVYVNNIQAYSPGLGITLVAGGVGAHEIGHLFLGGEMPYDANNPNIMMFSNVPEKDQAVPLNTDSSSSLWRFSPAQISQLFNTCTLLDLLFGGGIERAAEDLDYGWEMASTIVWDPREGYAYQYFFPLWRRPVHPPLLP